MSLPKDSNLIREAIRDLGVNKIIPNQGIWDQMQKFPPGLFRKLGKLGILGSLTPKMYGGIEYSYKEYAIILEEMAKLDPSIALALIVHNSLCIGHIQQYGNEQQKQKYLPKLVIGEWIGTWALNEAGSNYDTANLPIIGYKLGDTWVLNGTKHFIINGAISNVIVVIAKTVTEDGKEGVNAFIIEKDTAGLIVGPKVEKMGMRAVETVSLILKDCYVSSENVLGRIETGAQQVEVVLSEARLGMGILGWGIAKATLDAAVSYIKKCTALDYPIVGYEAITFRLAELSTQLQAASALNRHAIEAKMSNTITTKLAAMVQHFAAELAIKVSLATTRMMGDVGYTKDMPVERYCRDANFCAFGTGTPEVYKAIIAQELFS